MATSGFSYRLQSKSSDSDSENSDEDTKDWKRASGRIKDENLEEIPIIPPTPLPVAEEKIGPPKRKRNNIWSEVLEDQVMSETLNHCGIKNKPKGYGSRGEESYDYTLNYKYLKRDENSDKMSDNETTDLSKSSSFKNKKFQNNRYVKLDGPGIKVAKKIITTLGERKQYLIFRVVKYVGLEKALELLKMTEDVEESGGMLVNNQQRRRTPGGVYFQLLKADKDIKKSAIDKIFEDELNSYEMKRRYEQRKKLKKLEAEKNKLLKEFGELQNKQKEVELEKDDNLITMDEVETETPPVQTMQVFPSIKDSDREEGEIDD